MTNIRTLLASLAAQEAQFGETRFLAPCVQGGRVRARVAGLVQTFRPVPDGFEGWGIFQPTKHEGAALVVEEADLPLVADYCRLLMPLRLRLAHALSGQTWLAYPVNEGDARQRLGAARPVAVHLVTEGEAFEPILARGDGRVWWFEDGDRRADPQPADRLREALRAVTLPDAVRFAGLTPEMRTAYDLAARQSPAFAAQAQRRGSRRAASGRTGWRRGRGPATRAACATPCASAAATCAASATGATSGRWSGPRGTAAVKRRPSPRAT